MNPLRRKCLRVVAASAALVAASVTKASAVLAATWNKAAFDAKSSLDAVKLVGATQMTDSRDIVITAPDIAENGAVVPVAITSRIPNTQSISIVAEKNPFPLAATFDIAAGAEGYVSTRLKMGQTSNVRAIVKADGRYFTAVKEVKVTVGGCG